MPWRRLESPLKWRIPRRFWDLLAPPSLVALMLQMEMRSRRLIGYRLRNWWPRDSSREEQLQKTLWDGPWCAPQTVIHWLSERKALQNSRVFWSRVPSSPADKTRHPKMIWALWVSDVSIGSSMVHGRALPAEQVPQALCCIPLWSNKAERLARNATILPGIRELAELGSHNVNSCSHMGHAYVWLKIWVQKELLQTAFCLSMWLFGSAWFVCIKTKKQYCVTSGLRMRWKRYSVVIAINSITKE